MSNELRAVRGMYDILPDEAGRWESLEQTRAYAMLFYIDAIEFNGKHLRQFYVNVNERFEAYLASERGRRAIRASLRRSLVVERLVDEWFDAHPQAWPAWAPDCAIHVTAIADAMEKYSAERFQIRGLRISLSPC